MMRMITLIAFALTLCPSLFGGCNPNYQVCTCDGWNNSTIAKNVKQNDTTDHTNGGSHGLAGSEAVIVTYTQGNHFPGGYYCLPTIADYFPVNSQYIDGVWTIPPALTEYGTDFPYDENHCDNWNQYASRMSTDIPQSVFADAGLAGVVTQMALSLNCSGEATIHYGNSNVATFNPPSNGTAIWKWQYSGPLHYAGYEEIPDGSTPLGFSPSGTKFQDLFGSADPDECVRFDADGDGRKECLAWPRSDADFYFLVLPDKNGKVTSFRYNMFGNLTSQIMPKDLLREGKDGTELRNGFNALVHRTDKGEGATEITKDDAIWKDLRLWKNRAHDGIYKPEESYTLDTFGIVRIGLSYPTDYHKSGLHDQYGNRALVEGTAKLSDGSTLPMWDVVFQVDMSK